MGYSSLYTLRVNGPFCFKFHLRKVIYLTLLGDSQVFIAEFASDA